MRKRSFISPRLIFGLFVTFFSLFAVGIIIVFFTVGSWQMSIGLPIWIAGTLGILFSLVVDSVYRDRGKAARLKLQRRQEAERESQRLKEEEEKRIITMKQDVENFRKAGRYEDAARLYEQLGMWEEAGECRKMARTTYVVAADVHVGKDGVSVNCPLCGSSERVESKSSEVTCKHCGRKYYIPKKILDLI